MDIFVRDGGLTTADAVHKREEFRQIVADVQDLPETQKTALLLREIDVLSHGQVAEGLAKTSAPVRRHLKSCDRCRTFKGELRRANRALAAIYPLTPLIV